MIERPAVPHQDNASMTNRGKIRERRQSRARRLMADAINDLITIPNASVIWKNL
jgi:hypothetical protein